LASHQGPLTLSILVRLSDAAAAALRGNPDFSQR